MKVVRLESFWDGICTQGVLGQGLPDSIENDFEEIVKGTRKKVRVFRSRNFEIDNSKPVQFPLKEYADKKNATIEDVKIEEIVDGSQIELDDDDKKKK